MADSDNLVVDLSGSACTSIVDDLRPDLVELCLMCARTLRRPPPPLQACCGRLRYNRIERIEKLEQLAALQKLSLRANRITELRGVGHCRALRELELYENRLTRLEGLEGLERLEVRPCSALAAAAARRAPCHALPTACVACRCSTSPSTRLAASRACRTRIAQHSIA